MGKHCIESAVDAATSLREFYATMPALREAAGTNQRMALWNDQPGRTWADVERVIKKAGGIK